MWPIVAARRDAVAGGDTTWSKRCDLSRTGSSVPHAVLHLIGPFRRERQACSARVGLRRGARAAKLRSCRRLVVRAVVRRGPFLIARYIRVTTRRGGGIVGMARTGTGRQAGEAGGGLGEGRRLSWSGVRWTW